MDEFLFEENLLESIEVISYEERDINVILRENAHALLDYEMDLQDIMESEIVMEGFIDIIKEKISKIISYINKFIEWVKNFVKSKQPANNNNQTTPNEKPSKPKGNNQGNVKECLRKIESYKFEYEECLASKAYDMFSDIVVRFNKQYAANLNKTNDYKGLINEFNSDEVMRPINREDIFSKKTVQSSKWLNGSDGSKIYISTELLSVDYFSNFKKDIEDMKRSIEDIEMLYKHIRNKDNYVDTLFNKYTNLVTATSVTIVRAYTEGIKNRDAAINKLVAEAKRLGREYGVEIVLEGSDKKNNNQK